MKIKFDLYTTRFRGLMTIKCGLGQVNFKFKGLFSGVQILVTTNFLAPDLLKYNIYILWILPTVLPNQSNELS